MNPKDFVLKYLPFAKKTEDKTGFPAKALLVQAALESGWGKACPGNMMFGVKDTDGINGNEQLITTTEYSTRIDLKFPVVISVTPVVIKGKKLFKYRVKDYFRKYATPEESFTDHANFILTNPRYKKAVKAKADPGKFLGEIAAAGYATDPKYAEVCARLLTTISKYV